MKELKLCIILFSLLFIPLIAHSESFETTIDDKAVVGKPDNTYWGGNLNYPSYGNRDVIGDPYFSVENMVVVQNGNLWTVTLTGPYFEYRTDEDIDNGLPFKLRPGDLYISSTGYEAQGSGPNYPSDTFLQSEGWDYVIPILPNGGSGVFVLDYKTLKYSNVDGLTGSYVYRTGQAWQGGYDPASSLGWANYQFLNDSLIFSFNAANLDFSLGEVGFHWTMQCGNDVLEGRVPARDVPVPEPSTLLLLGLGLTGAFAYRKIRG